MLTIIYKNIDLNIFRIINYLTDYLIKTTFFTYYPPKSRDWEKTHYCENI
jgi:hypothetical protein